MQNVSKTKHSKLIIILLGHEESIEIVSKKDSTWLDYTWSPQLHPNSPPFFLSPPPPFPLMDEKFGLVKKPLSPNFFFCEK